MSGFDVPLATIRGALRGAIPSVIATCSADSVPNVTYMSVVSYIDDERIALSNQFMSKTLTNLAENPQVAIRVIDPETMYEYDIDARHIGHEVSGELFDSTRDATELLRANPNAFAIEEMQDVVKRIDTSYNERVATAM